ncbi:MAG TPA: glucose-6-phosphate dehydrogenase [Bryobacteraceae bacterium]|jgi:glucose-6-phosphate 1-dehydrogenase|nr:glucose-6-phosphate dehydrogenase [Bryobacteraceae bacterium]
MSPSATTLEVSKSQASWHELKPAGPCVLVIFGITGDLAARLLVPALYNLASTGLLPDNFAIAGFALPETTEEQLRDKLVNDLRTTIGPEADQTIIDRLMSSLRFVGSDFESPSGWQQLHEVLAEQDRTHQTCSNYLFYLATAPELFLPLVQHLAQEGLLKEEGGKWRRVIIEKPFGHDLESARELNRQLLAVVREEQIYRIDHYLGKETVQNIMVFRFANGIFEPIWNRRYVDHVQITVAESLGVEQRGRYYDHTGALRDMIPNHLVQVLALIAMEPASSFTATAFRNEQVKVLDSVPPIVPDECAACVVRGQYTAGIVEGRPVPGYRSESYVNPHSVTGTFAALKLAVDNWRWAGVPFYLRTGKRMSKRSTQVVVQFRKPPLTVFRTGPSLPQPNCLVIGIQPQESISIEFEAKVPGPGLVTSPVGMHFDYRDHFHIENRTGYETLLYDAMIGDSSLFKRADMIEGGWAIVQPILDAWAAGHGGELHEYQAGTDGPVAADLMLDRDGRRWRKV